LAEEKNKDKAQTSPCLFEERSQKEVRGLVESLRILRSHQFIHPLLEFSQN